VLVAFIYIPSATALAVVACLAVPALALAQNGPAVTSADTVTLSITDIPRVVVAQDPRLRALRQETAIALGVVRQARLLQFNPDLAVQAVRGGTGGATELLLTEEIEWAGQRGLRLNAARSGLDRTTAEVQNWARLSIAEASGAFYRAVVAERRLSVAQEADSVTRRLIAAVRTQLAEGEISTLEANLAEIEAGRSRGRVVALQRAAMSATLALKQHLGLDPETPLVLHADTTGTSSAIGAATLQEDSLVTLALAQRPDLVATAAAVRESESRTTLARREVIPTLRLGAAVERATTGGGLAVGPAVGFSIPLFNRNQGLIDQRRAAATQARLTQRATELRIRSELAEAIRAYRAADSEVRIFATLVQRPAHDNIALLDIAFREGKIALPTLLLLRNQLLDAEFGYWDAWLAQREALVRLHAAAGMLTPPTGALPPVDDAADDHAPAKLSTLNL
jgi:cobalt-zinc-cadmium efflux system outer membrane protein